MKVREHLDAEISRVDGLPKLIAAQIIERRALEPWMVFVPDSCETLQIAGIEGCSEADGDENTAGG